MAIVLDLASDIRIVHFTDDYVEGEIDNAPLDDLKKVKCKINSSTREFVNTLNMNGAVLQAIAFFGDICKRCHFFHAVAQDFTHVPDSHGDVHQLCCRSCHKYPSFLTNKKRPTAKEL